MPSTVDRSTIDWAIKHRTPAIRHALIHLLAIKPETLLNCASKVGSYKEVVKPILEKIATENDNGEWDMGNKSYKELEPWSFRYSQTQREDIIEKAIKAYDRLRVDPKDPVWQKLLPLSERNQGKTLSRLNLNPTQSLTPSMKPKVIDRKTGLPKRTEPKKVTESKAKDKNAGKLSPYPAKDKEATPKPSRSDSPLLKASTTNKVNKSSKLGQSPAQRPIKEAKPSAPAKSLLNKPRNPSPLSKSPPVNASDFEDNHPVHKTFSAAASPSKSGSTGSIKRKAQDTGADRHREPASKKARVDNLLSVSKAGKPSPSLKRKSEENSSSSLDSTPLKLRKLANSSADNVVRARSSASSKAAMAPAAKQSTSSNKRPRSSTQVSDDSSVTSPDYVTSHSKRLELAEDFKRYYSKYKHFHMDLSGRSDSPSKDEVARLMEMHNRVAEMKKQLAAS
jgi:RNA polymerase II elongation factor ELL